MMPTPAQMRALGLGGDRPDEPKPGTPADTSQPATYGQAPPATDAPTGGTQAPEQLSTSLPAAIYAGIGQGATTVANAIPSLTGSAPWVSPSNINPGAVEAHPWGAAIGRGIGEAAATAPVVAIGTALAPEALVGGAARYGANALVGALTGIGQSLASTTPNESWWDVGKNALINGAIGAGLGPVGGVLFRGAGGNQVLEGATRDAGNLLRNEGVDLTTANLPLAGGAAEATGAKMTATQAAQLNRAFASKMGEKAADFSDDTIKSLESTMGPKIDTAASKLSVDPSAPGSTFLSDLNNARAAAADPMKIMDPQDRIALNAKIDQIMSQLRASPTGTIGGAQFHDLVGYKSDLADWTSGAIKPGSPGFNNVAGMIDDALRKGAQVSSSPDDYSNWINTRTNYKLLQLIKASRTARGNVNPSNIWSRLATNFPNSTQPNIIEAKALAQAANTAFGGGAAPAAGAAGRSLPTAMGTVGTVGALAGYGAHAALPSLAPAVSPFIGGGAALAPLIMRGVTGAAGRYATGPAMVNRLLTRTAPPTNYLTPLTASTGVALSPW